MFDLKEFREELGYSKQQLADFLNISKSLYEKVEWGVRLPSQAFLFRFKQKFPSFDMNLFFTEKKPVKK